MTTLTTLCAKSLCAAASVVISLSLLGSVALGLTTPATVASAIAGTASA